MAALLGFFTQEPKQNTSINPEFKELLDKIYDDNIPTLSVEELKDLNRENVFLLDTRADEEYTISHLKNARRVGYLWFDMRELYDIPKSATLVIYCAVGNRSVKIAEKLVKGGYKNVSVLYGGIFEWVNEGYPVYTHSNIQTTQVHAYSKDWSKWLEKGNKVL